MSVNFHSFTQTDEWQRILQVLDKISEAYVEDIISAGEEGNVHKVMHITGRLGMIRELKVLPETLLGQKEYNNAEKSHEETGSLSTFERFAAK